MSDLQRHLNGFLLEPRETLEIEFKSWLSLSTDKNHKAILAKAIIALANHGGGYIILGFKHTTDGSITPDTPRPSTFADYTDDCVNSISGSYLDPAIHCEVRTIAHPETGLTYPVIAVPEGRVPVRSKKGSPDTKTLKDNHYYIRRAGPKSEPPQSGHEWDRLLERCLMLRRADLLHQFRLIMAGESLTPTTPVQSDFAADKKRHDEVDDWETKSLARWSTLRDALPKDHVARLDRGHYTVCYKIGGEFQPPDLPKFLELLRQARVPHTGWPMFVTLSRKEVAPYVKDGAIESWIGAETRVGDPETSDFWRAAPDGRLFLIRGHAEDGATKKAIPGSVFDIAIPSWRCGEALLHASRLAALLDVPNAPITLKMRWTGLENRRLTHLARTRMLFDDRVIKDDTYSSETVARANEIPDRLPELVDAMLRPLYAMFEFFPLPATLVAEELQRMRVNQF